MATSKCVLCVGRLHHAATACKSLATEKPMPSLGVNIDHIAKVINNGYKGVEQLA